jgi:hypothetical protein
VATFRWLLPHLELVQSLILNLLVFVQHSLPIVENAGTEGQSAKTPDEIQIEKAQDTVIALIMRTLRYYRRI